MVALVALAGSLAACDSRSAESTTITRAASNAQAAGTVADSASGLAKSMQAQGSAVQEAMTKGTPGEQSAAALISSQAQQAQAEADAQQAMLGDQEIRRTLLRVSELSTLWTLKTAVASTAEQFDPSPQITQLGKDAESKDSEQTQLESQRDKFAAQIKDLDARAAQATTSAKGLLDQASALQQQASSGSARAGVSLVEEAAKLRRQGDRLRLEGDTLTAQADQLRPQLLEVEAIISQLTNQKAKLKLAQDALRTRQASAQQEARQSRELAGELEKKLDEAVAAIYATRDGQFQPSFDKAKNGFSKAAGDGKKAGGDAGKLSAGTAQLSLSTLLNGRAELLGSMAGTMKVLVDATPALPKKAEYEAKYNSLLEERKGVVEEASTALEAAQATFASVSVRDPQVRERLDKLKELLERSKLLRSGEVKNLDANAPSEGATSPAPAGDTASTTPAPEGGAAATPVDAARKALGEMAKLTKECNPEIGTRYYFATSPEGEKMLAFMRKSMGVNCALEKACQAKFQMSATDVMAKNAMMAQQAQASKAMDPAHWDVNALKMDEISATSVVATVPGSPMPLNLELHEGAWKVNVDNLGALVAMPGADAMMESVLGVSEAWAAKITAGEYADAQAAADAYGTLLMEAMQKQMGQPGGAGPRGRGPGGG